MNQANQMNHSGRRTDADTYPTYKPSNIDWIGEIPEHWEVTKVKFVAEIFGRIGYRGYTIEDIVDEGKGAITISPSNIQSDIFTIENVTCISWEKYYESPEIMIFENDIVLVKTGSTIGKTAIIPRGCPEMTINPQLVVLKNIKIDNKFFYYQTICDYFKHSFVIEQTGSTTPTISQEKINSFPLLSFPLPEQQAIVKYLDQKTTLIDELIAKKQSKIELLKEQRTALINHAVTKGLNDDVDFKDSGLTEIGFVPNHWQIKKLKFTAFLKSGDAITSEEIDENGHYPVFGGNGFRGFCEKFNYEGHYVLIGRQGALCGNINYAKGLFWASEHAVVVSITGKDETIWLGELLRNMNLNQYSQSAAQPGLAVEKIKNLSIPVPPIAEQQAIVAYLDEQTALIDKGIALESQKIEKLKEYRQSLISAVVTGKICVLD